MYQYFYYFSTEIKYFYSCVDEGILEFSSVFIVFKLSYLRELLSGLF